MDENLEFLRLLESEMKKNFDVEDLKGKVTNITTATSTIINKDAKNTDNNIKLIEKHSKLKMSNLLISQEEISSLLLGSKFFIVSDFKCQKNASFLLSNYKTTQMAIMGVICQKYQKKTSSGKNYCQIVLTSLRPGVENYFSYLNAFDKAYEIIWKAQISSLLLIKNPGVFQSKKTNQFIYFNISSVNDLFLLGQTSDFGICKGIVKSNGNPCTRFVNRSYGDYCEYHIISANKNLNRRAELQPSYGTPVLKISGAQDNIELKPFLNHNSQARDSMDENKSTAQTLESFSKPTKSLDDYVKVPSSGSINLLKYRNAQDKKNGNESFTHFSSFLSDDIDALNNKSQNKRRLSQTEIKSIMSQSKKSHDFLVVNDKKDIAKKKVLEVVSKMGGIPKLDPNTVFSKNYQIQKSSKIDSQPVDPAKDKPSLSEKQKQKIKNAKSSYSELIKNNDDELVDKYFDNKIEKEMIEEKMAEISELNILIYCCKTCGYKSEYLNKKCFDSQHRIIKIKATKKFFKCASCSNQVTCFTSYPVDPCSKCGNRTFLKSSLLREKKGPPVGGESLIISDPSIIL